MLGWESVTLLERARDVRRFLFGGPTPLGVAAVVTAGVITEATVASNYEKWVRNNNIRSTAQEIVEAVPGNC